MKKVAISMIVAVLVFSFFIQEAEAGGSIKGPDTVYIGKQYQYSVSCNGMRTSHVEVGFIPGIVSPRVLSGVGTLYFQPDWFGWSGDSTWGFRAVFKLQPSVPGKYRVWVECWGDSAWDSSYIDITVRGKRKENN